ncbi:MAG: YfhO family protein [Clostridiales bacterium]|nr:YfhO family protein [Clostridiales bacterium]
MRQWIKKIKRIDIPFLLAAVIPVVIVVLAYTLAQTEPGSILPVEATLRRLPMDEALMNAVNRTADDVSSIRNMLSYHSSVLRLQGLKMFISEYFDPFVLISLLFGYEASKGFLLGAFFIRFGLAGASMYYLLSQRRSCGTFFTVLLSVLYSVGAVSFLSSGTVSGMDVVILLPLMFCYLDRFSDKPDAGSFCKAVVFSALVFMSGLIGLISGTFVALTFALFISVVRYPSFGKALLSFLKLFLVSVIGILISGIVNVPRIRMIDIAELPEDLFTDGKMYFKIFDLLSFTSSGMSVNNSDSLVPAMFFGITSLALIVILYFNRNTALRVKVVLSVVIVLYYAAMAYSPFVYVLSFIRSSSVYSTGRLTGLIVILIFAASMSVESIGMCGKMTIYGTGFALLGVIVISNCSENVYGFYNYQLFMTFISVIAVTVFLVTYREGASTVYKTVFGVLCFIGLTANLSYVFMMSDVNENGYAICTYTSSSDDAYTLDVGIDVPVFGSRDSYVVLPADFDQPKAGQNIATAVNEMSSALSMGAVFEDMDMDEYMNIGFGGPGDGYYTVDEEYSEMVVGGEWYNTDRVFVSSGLGTHIKLSVLDYDSDDNIVFLDLEGPFMKEISYDSDSYEISFISDKITAVPGEIGLYSLNSYVLDSLNAVAGDLTENEFTIPDDLIISKGAAKVLLTSMPYDSARNIYINNRRIETFDYMGKLAGKFTYNTGIPVEVRISSRDSGFVQGAIVTVIGAAGFALTIILLRRKWSTEAVSVV